ncbi:MAG TPA: alpha/beta hydrolase [Oligoflexus sp.]|uniref:alpha/beta hydrolase n=1 Tax=Oligoflexus sp. TaxID=1971216 RepID=UPI002D7E4271|nr:alpha/beta hydrolase [Oligoflexus sp.]HET9237859.1 alpha/beta hydrolase [Oligoflexus sp.]
MLPLVNRSILILALITSLSSGALAQNRFTETELPEAFSEILNPFLNSAQSEAFIGTGGKSLQSYRWLRNDARAHILILTGFSENVLKYRELAYLFYQEGYSVHLYEHRGHGRSELLTDERQKMYVTDFEDYVKDLGIYLQTFLASEELPILALTHSMGGTVLTRHLQQNANSPIKAAYMASPMFDLFTDGYPRPVLTALTKAAILAGQGQQYVFGRGPLDPGTLTIDAFGDNTSEVRFQAYIQDSAKAGVLQGNATFGWTYAALKATGQLMKEKNIKKINRPLFIAQAEFDTVVRSDAQTKFCALLSQCRIQSFPGRHALIYEKDEIFVPFTESVLLYFTEQLNTP